MSFNIPRPSISTLHVKIPRRRLDSNYFQKDHSSIRSSPLNRNFTLETRMPAHIPLTHRRIARSRNTHARVQRACRPISIAWNLKRPQPERSGIRFDLYARESNRYPINDDTRKNNNNERWPRMQEQPSGKYFLSGWLAVDWEPTWKLRIYPLFYRDSPVVSRGTINETTERESRMPPSPPYILAREGRRDGGRRRISANPSSMTDRSGRRT